MTEKVSRMEVLLSMPQEDRLNCLADELYYGQFYAERDDDGYRRRDPLEQGDTPDPTDESLGRLGLADRQRDLPLARITDLSEDPDA